MRVLGMISGTSHDGIDTAIVDFQLDAELLTARIEHSASTVYEPNLRTRIIDALPPAPVGFDVACQLDTAIGQAFAAAAASVIQDHQGLTGVGPVDVICSHGQTVYHWVQDRAAHGTLQLGQPAWIAELTGLPVISDVRAADVAAGGHGAPLVPILDVLLLGAFLEQGRAACALNLGGIANVTACTTGAEPVAWDIGPANALIDAVITASPAVPDSYDRDGGIGRSGQVLPDLLDHLLAEVYYQLAAPKSCGKELFHLGYVQEALHRTSLDPGLPDLVATLTELTAVTVAQALSATRTDIVVASGGGVSNHYLMERIEGLMPHVKIIRSDELGVSADHKEALAFALIGWATMHSLPSNVPSCTGASGDRVLGRFTPGQSGRLPQPPPGTTWPTRLTVESARHGDE